MKRIAKLIVSAAVAASLMVGAGVSASACVYTSDVVDTTITLSRIESSIRSNSYPNYGGQFLISDRTIKKGSLRIGSDQIFTVSRGTTLTLDKGMHVDGTLYIQKGGKVVVRGNTLINCGNIICDGELCIGENAWFSLLKESKLLVNKSGSLEVNCDYVTFNNTADILCLGELKYEYLSEYEVDMLKANPILAIVKGRNGENYKKVTSKKTLEKYLDGLQTYDMANGDYKSVSMMFDSGTVLKFTKLGDITGSIGTVDVTTLDGLADETLEWVAREKAQGKS